MFFKMKRDVHCGVFCLSLSIFSVKYIFHAWLCPDLSISPVVICRHGTVWLLWGFPAWTLAAG